jgi:hypothetical protein
VKRGPLLSFESSAFPVTPGEDEGTNPGIYGRELASWISEQLRAVGRHAGSVIPEDFGWCVPVSSPPYSLYVVCASGELAGHWQIFVFSEGGLVDRFLRKDRSAELVADLYTALRHCLESSPVVYGLGEEPTAQ